jgi:hypothetical protein
MSTFWIAGGYSGIKCTSGRSANGVSRLKIEMLMQGHRTL